MRINISCSLLLVVFLSRFTIDVKCFDVKIVGIYSICGSHYAENEFNEEGYNLNVSLAKEINQLATRIWYGDFWRYVSFDVCHDQNELQRVITKLMLDSQFNTRAAEKVFELEGFQFNANKSTNILLVVAHVKEKMLEYLLDVFSFTNIRITKYSNLINTTLKMRSNENFKNLDFTVDDVITYIENRWQDFVIVSTNQFYVYEYTANEIKKSMKRKGNMCYRALSVTSDDKEKLKSFLVEKNITNSYQIVIFCGKMSLEWVRELGLNRPNRNIMFLPFYAEYIYYSWYVELFSESRYPTRSREISASLRLSYDVQNVMSMFWSTVSYKQCTSCEDFLSLCEYSRSLVTNFLLKQRMPNETTTSQCQHQICPPGYEKVFGDFPDEMTQWDEEFGYYCSPCKRNLYKSTHGDSKCIPCSGYLVPNQQNTDCMDPYTKTFNTITQNTGCVVVLISSVGCTFAVLSIGVFIKHRDTPIGKASDLPFTLAQLIVITLLFCNLPILYFTEPNVLKCALRTVIVYLLYNINVSIVYVKSIKLVEAFSAKVRRSRSEVRRTVLVQTFTVLINIVIGLLLIAVMWQNNFPSVIEDRRKSNLKNFMHCNCGSTDNTLIIFMVIMHLGCFAQAFRSRNLPSHLNETMTIMYASLIATVAFSVMFPIYYSKKSKENAELVHVLVLAGNNLILLFMLYGKKVYNMVLHPERNTKEYFRRMQMEQIEMQSQKFAR